MTRGAMRSLLRGWIRINRHDRYGRAGFVLPTVTMVLLVVVLLTITIMFRSMDRAKMAQYRRVDEQVLQAATPALDRAREKIKYLLSGNDKSLPRETPSDNELNRALNDDFYNLGDEQRLQIQYDVDGVAGITVKNGTNFKPLEDQDAIQTAWRFPVDTNNDGKFDSFTYYGIFFRKPGTDRTRNPLDARTPPMTLSSDVSLECQAILSSGGTSTLVDDSGWSRTDGNLKKAFFVYTTTVPITEADINGSNLIKNSQNELVFPANKYLQFQGTPSFSALEYQVDVSRVPLTNNAVVYEDDLIITPGSGFNLNGRIFTNSNLIASPFVNDDFKLYQVSGINSCFYREENGKVIVAGNVINGMTDQVNSKSVQVHLYQGAGTNPTATQKITTANQSINTAVYGAMYDDAAYKARLSALIDDLRATTGDKEILATNMPPSIEAIVQKRLTEDSTLKPDTVREEELRAYFKARIRKVTQADNKTIPAKGAVVTGLGTEGLRPATDTWMLPTNAAGTGSTSGVTFLSGQLQQTEPETQKTNGKENYLGDRVIAGNNLPALKYDSTINPPWKTAGNLPVGTEKWTDPNTVARTRSTQVKALPNLGDTKRDGYWEKAAAQKPKAPLDSIGGLRVITGAGVYEPRNSFLPRPRWASTVDTYDDPATSATETFPIVWPDTMPMSPVTGVTGVKVYDNSGSDSWVALPTTLPAAKTPTIDPNTPQYAKGDLRMRASVVYHYSSDAFDPPTDTDQQPIACVSSYYDPTNRITAKNSIDVDGGFGKDTTNGKSNNGVAYPKPTTARPTSASYSSTTGLYTVSGGAAELGTQANYVFPDGRFANPALRDALQTLVDGDDLTLANQAAIDSTLCSLDILSGSITPSDTVIPHRAIREVTLLNAREVKANEPDDTSTTVDETFTLSSPPTQKAQLNARATLPLEERMPQEVRLTRIDLGALRNQEITQGVTTGPKTSGDKEYLLPFSGIIYASRDDALPDLSKQPDTLDTPADLEESAADLKLDPTRRPNGILLANGAVLKRPLPASPTVQEVVQDKGLTLVSNLPVYVQGNFNKHTQQEFTGTFSWTFADYYGRPASALNPNFACHANDPRIQAGSFKCDTGDDWRPANVLADAITLLSDNFRFGYRDEGDFDLRNNAGSPIIKGYDLNGDGIISATAGYDLNGDGIISATAGYDFNRNGKIDDTDPTVDEATYNLDLNKDEDKTDTELKETDVLFMGRIGHDLNGNGTISALDPAGDETKYGFDLNGDGHKTDTAVKETEVNFVMKYDETKYNFDFNGDGDKTDTAILETDADFKFIATKVAETLFLPAAFDETKYGIDLNGDGDKTDTAVLETDIAITAKMARQLNGFLNNDYAINGLSSGGTGRFDIDSDGTIAATEATPTDENYRSTTGTILNSSYFNNFVTPVQRRLDTEKNSTTGAPKPNTNDPKEFLTEICLKLPVSACGTGDWSVIAFGGSVIPTRNLDNTVVPVASLLSGTTATPPAVQYQRFPRRVAFQRNPSNQLILNSNLPTPLGVTAAGDITNVFANIRNNQNNTLWFQTRNGANRNTNGANPLWYYNPTAPNTSVSTFAGLENTQPLLVPILQIHATNSTTISTATETTAAKIFPVGDEVKASSRWVIQAATTEFNLVMATGDIPARPVDNNGGLQNLPRFLENWQFSEEQTATIAGAFIQTNRSSYASAPYYSVVDNNATYPYAKRPPGMFGNSGDYASKYRNFAASGKIGYFLPPKREWGFDVGLLSQPPDLFAQKFSLTDDTLEPDEYFREVSRDDEWVTALLCSKVAPLPTATSGTISTTKAIPSQVCDAKYGGQVL
ncbi:hypothetical protein H6G57_25960 [Planktothrix sp. FACHB-1365]|nr:hypothetical protein [Planktothrix sp. FACHB-1365]